MNYESCACNKQNFSVQQTQSTIPTSSAPCQSSKKTPPPVSEKPSCPRKPKEPEKKPCACNPNEKDKDNVPTFCACNIKPNQTELTFCTCEATQKPTYSAQYQATQSVSQQEQTCNTIPLYSVPANTGQDGTQYSCPCSSFPPPPYPPQSDLWDLQFCRWWGWNWIRRREELMNKQKAAEIQTDKKCSCKQKKKSRNKFMSWCCRKMNGKPKHLRCEEKRCLQHMYDTPCSSIVMNDEGCCADHNNSESYSIDIKGACKYCGHKPQCTSTSTIILKKKKKHSSKHNVRRQHSWICTKTESTTSNEVYQCVSEPQISNQSSTEDSIEFLSVTMERVRSVCEDDDEDESCPHIKKKQHMCKHCSPPKKKKKRPETCPFKVKQESPRVCEHHKRLKHKCPGKSKKQKGPHLCLCKSMPVCRCSPPPNKIPIFKRYLQPHKCKSPPCTPKHSKPQKKQKEYKVCYVCEKGHKKPKPVEESPKVYFCCCCNCCNKCCQGDDDKRNEKPKKGCKRTVDKSVSCLHQPDPCNAPLAFSLCNDFIPSNPNCCTINQLLTNNKVSGALDAGLFSSPVTGRTFSLNPKTFTPTPMTYNGHLPEPIDVNDGSLFSGMTPAKSADVEHRHLLQAVCNAIMSSHTSFNTVDKVIKPPRINTKSRKDDGKYLSCQRSCELAVHQYDTDTTDQNEAIIDLFPPNMAHCCNHLNERSKNTKEGSCSVKQKTVDLDLLKKVSYSSLKKVYNERTFPFKKCRIGNTLPSMEPGESSDASPSTCTTEHLCALETPESSVISEDRRKRSKNADILNIYSARVSPRMYSPTTLQTPPTQDTTKRADVRYGAKCNDENSRCGQQARDRPKTSLLSDINDVHRNHTVPFSTITNLTALNNLVDLKRLPTITEQQASTADRSSSGSETRSSSATRNRTKPEQQSDARPCCSKRDSPLSLLLSPNSSKICSIVNKHKVLGSNRYLKKKSSSKIDKELKAMEKRWRS